MATTRDPSFLPTAMVPTLTLTRVSPSFDRSQQQQQQQASKTTPPSSSSTVQQACKPVSAALVPSVARPLAISPINVLGAGGKMKQRSAGSAAAGVTQLPLTRIRTVMKTAPNSNAIGLNSSVALAKAAELFVAKLAQESLVVALETHSAHEVTYKHLANAVRKHPKTMKFLFEFLPHKVAAKDIIESSITSNTTTPSLTHKT